MSPDLTSRIACTVMQVLEQGLHASFASLSALPLSLPLLPLPGPHVAQLVALASALRNITVVVCCLFVALVAILTVGEHARKGKLVSVLLLVAGLAGFYMLSSQVL